MVHWHRAKKKVGISHNSKWYPCGVSKSGCTKYYYKIEQRGRGGVYKYKKHECHGAPHEPKDRRGNLIFIMWLGLKKAWIAWDIYLSQADYDHMEFYAAVIQNIQEKLEVPITHFPILEGGKDAQDSYYKMHRFVKSSNFLPEQKKLTRPSLKPRTSLSKQKYAKYIKSFRNKGY